MKCWFKVKDKSCQQLTLRHRNNNQYSILNEISSQPDRKGLTRPNRSPFVTLAEAEDPKKGFVYKWDVFLPYFCVLGTISSAFPIWWISGCWSLWEGTMLPCHVSSWPSAEPPASCGSHGPPVQPAQPLPDLLCSCPAPSSLNTHSETPSPDPMESLIVVTEYEPSMPPGEAGEEEEVRWNTPRWQCASQRCI